MVEAPDLPIGAGREVGRQVLLSQSVDGVVCPSDLLAVGVIQAATDLGIRVPDDLMVVGYDDNHFASESSIPVSTVSLPGIGWVSWPSNCSSRRSGRALATCTERSRWILTSSLDAARFDRTSTARSRKELMSLTWSALPIAPNEDFDGAPLLRTEFGLEEGHGPVTRATLHATAHGVFEAYLNGQPVSDDVLSPGWSSYEWRLRYRSYDVTSLLQPRRCSVLRWAMAGFADGSAGAAAGPSTARSLQPSHSSRSSFPTATSRPS